MNIDRGEIKMNSPQATLRDKIIRFFSSAELEVLCFDLGIKHEFLEGKTLPNKVQSLIEYCARHQKLDELYKQLKTSRENEEWPDQLLEEIKKQNSRQDYLFPTSKPKNLSLVYSLIVGLIIVIAGVLYFVFSNSPREGELTAATTPETLSQVSTVTEAPATNTPMPSPSTFSTPTSVPEETLEPETTEENMLAPYFFDEFESDSIDSAKWEDGVGEPFAYFSIKNGHLYSPSEMVPGCENGWCMITMQALDDGTFSMLETKLTMVSESTDGLINFNTSCTVAPYTSMTLELVSDGRVIGRHQLESGGPMVALDWDYEVVQGQEYIIRLEQAEGGVNVFIGDMQMEPPFPCPEMGDWFNVGSASISGGYAEAIIDYIYLWEE